MSAISTDKHLFVLKSINDVLKPGGLVLFRDYAIYDEAELRFNGNRRVTEHMFARQDGTLAFFFEKHGLIKCFQESGYKKLPTPHPSSNITTLLSTMTTRATY